MNYQEYEKQCKLIVKDNSHLLNEFTEHMRTLVSTEEVVQEHVSNIEFFINTYLLREEPIHAKNGITFISPFLSYFFPSKCGWSSVKTLKRYIASFKRFYKFMLFTNRIEESAYDSLSSLIKEEKDEWLFNVDYVNH